MKEWKIALTVSVSLAVLFIVIGGLNHGFSPRAILLLGLSGFFIGAIAAPEIEPKAFSLAILWQGALGGMGGATIGFFISPVAGNVIAGGLLGVLLGLLAPYWVKHVPLP